VLFHIFELLVLRQEAEKVCQKVVGEELARKEEDDKERKEHTSNYHLRPPKLASNGPLHNKG
jgi:hypothetical protein